MKYILWILVTVLMATTNIIKADTDFSLAVEFANNTLDLSDPNLSKGYDDSRHYFWAKAVITNESLSAKKLTTWSCSGAGFKVEPNSIQNVVKCKKISQKRSCSNPKKAIKYPYIFLLRKTILVIH